MRAIRQIWDSLPSKPLIALVGFVASLVTIGLCLWPNFASDDRCQIQAGELIPGRYVIETGKLMRVTVSAENPSDQAMIYRWTAVHGSIVPEGITSTSQGDYTAPLFPTRDTIAVEIAITKCDSIKRRVEVEVIHPVATGNSPQVTPSLVPLAVPATIVATEPAVVLVSPTPVPVGIIEAKFYSDINLNGSVQFQSYLITTPNDRQGYSFDYGSSQDPARQAVLKESFGARFSGRFEFAAGEYHFHCQARDGCRIEVERDNVIDAWYDNSGGHNENAVVSDGIHTVTIEYYDKSGQGFVEIAWDRVNAAVDSAQTTLPFSSPTTQSSSEPPNLVVNGDFLQHWEQGWKRIIGDVKGETETLIVKSHQTTSGSALYLKYEGESALTLDQTIPVSSVNVMIEATLNPQAEAGCLGILAKCSGVAGMIVYLHGDEQAAEEELGMLLYVHTASNQDILYSDQHRVISLPAGWQTLQLNLRDEIQSKLPKMDITKIKSIRLELMTGSTGACKGTKCKSELTISDLKVVPQSQW